MAMTPDAPGFDLLALATIRRTLLELGFEIGPDPEGSAVGTLELWMHAARDDLDGLSPLQALRQPDGPARVRACLAALAARRDGPAAA
ncbi:MAG: hypothetical protein ABW220_18795 [Burkholderiaceae bacterium]